MSQGRCAFLGAMIDVPYRRPEPAGEIGSGEITRDELA
jgi:hypothetical protein